MLVECFILAGLFSMFRPQRVLLRQTNIQISLCPLSYEGFQFENTMLHLIYSFHLYYLYRNKSNFILLKFYEIELFLTWKHQLHNMIFQN